MFGSTYIYELLLSKMKYIKVKIRSKLTDDHLDSLQRLAYSNIQVHKEKLSHQNQHQKYH